MAHVGQHEWALPATGLDALIEVLGAAGHVVVGPAVRAGVIAYDTVASADDLARGWHDDQAPGRYRLTRRDRPALFDHVVGPQSLKRFLHPSERRLWRADRRDGGIALEAERPPDTRYAFLGVRACDLASVAVLDRVLADDPHYRATRDGAFLVAVNCARAAATCFCTSMNTGPKATAGFDLALTELVDEAGHRFLLEVGSQRGRAIADALDLEPAAAEDSAAARVVVESTAGAIDRKLDAEAARAALATRPDHPRWDDVADRCLTCGNCTMVCPTCFCSDVADTSDLTGDHLERWQRWTSCFTLDFSYAGGGSVRTSAKSRYRQWLTHKLSSWHDQFGTSGCVGCGRCISWCPVGIDITEEAAAIAAEEGETP